MHLIANSISPNTVREEQRNGDQYYVVEDVPFVRAMRLAGGYVPEDSIKDATPDWDETPLTANHPRNNPGKPWYRSNVADNAPISVNTSETVHREYVIGQAENPRWDGEWTRADLAINATVANAMGGVAADIVEKIEAGDQFDVSSQYYPEQLPAGEYDGEHRANAERIRDPDSIAILPNKKGRCSAEHGCGANPSGVSANAADLDTVRVPTTDDLTRNRDGEDGGFETMQGDIDSDPESVGRRVLNAIGFTANDSEDDEAGEGSETDGGVEDDDEPAESGETTDTETTMSDKTAELVANHGFDEENLPSEDTECFSRIYEAVTSNDEDENEEEEQNGEETTESGTTVADMTVDELGDALAEQGFATEDDVAEAVSANSDEQEKDSLAQQVVANSAEYEDIDSVKEDYPTRASLEAALEQVAGGGVMPASGASTQVAANTSGEELDEYSDGSI